jgi:hypothetical protein
VRFQKVPDIFSELIEEYSPLFEGAIEIRLIETYKSWRIDITVIHEANMRRALIITHLVSRLNHLIFAAGFCVITLSIFSE